MSLSQRKQLLVDRPLQGRLMARLWFYVFVYALVVLHAHFIMQLGYQAVQNGLQKDLFSLYVDFLRGQSYLFLSAALVAPLLLVDSLKFSNRIAGPLFRCRTMMHELAAGKAVPEFTPRKGDFMPELWQAFNALIRTCNAHIDHPAEHKTSQQEPVSDHAGWPARASKVGQQAVNVP